MAIITNIREGQILYQYYEFRIEGHSASGWWQVEVISINIKRGFAECCWNGSSHVRRYFKKDLAILKVNKRK